MKCRITVICENSAGRLSGTLGENGFCALLECGGEMLLFDSGGGLTLLHNAQRMHLDLRRVERVVLSHGHYDHTGGLYPLLQSCGRKELIAHPALFTPRYTIHEGECRSVGIPYSRDFLAGLGATFSLERDFRELLPGLYCTGEVPRRTPFEEGDPSLCCDAAGVERDTVPDDQSLVLVTRKGLLLLLGCCHAGVVNTIELARERTGVAEVYGIIGGCHLAFSSAQQLEGTVKALRAYGVRKVCGGHCTGFSAAARLERDLPGAFRPAQVGYTIECEL
ncbi:MBL fold metallo-hydrolase [Geomonas sp. RF6]|uniref:MBL fold metallo-hydrolase n=1 Tax=Geomonas sp. RF6 TaxID=2897342 RepID=UPI001E3DD3B0|nr:MBL fold metallo-hydrolase [Geomonas sp. RF6]UFS72317.1 MBL fold metallo-hydrolase [Geomonas sp. RF6]